MKRVELIVITLLIFIFSTFLGYNFQLKYPNLIFDFTGYDPLMVGMITKPIDSLLATIRHPLLAIFTISIYPFYYFFNSILTITIFISIIFTLSNIFFFKTLRNNFEINTFYSLILLLLLNSFAYIIPMSFIPDSYPLSFFALTISIYFLTLEKQKNSVTYWLFILTSGITITNGLKILLVNLLKDKNYIHNIKQNFKIVVLFFLIITPIWIISKKISSNNNLKSINKEIVVNTNNSNKLTGSINVNSPGFLTFLDNRTPFLKNISENFIGESILFHPISLELDPSDNRPLLIKYNHFLDYIVVWSLFVFFIFILIYKYKNKHIKTVILFFIIDIVIHLIGRFGFNEIYIFGPHWLFLIPISFAILLKDNSKLYSTIISIYLILIVMYLSYSNYSAILKYLFII